MEFGYGVSPVLGEGPETAAVTFLGGVPGYDMKPFPEHSKLLLCDLATKAGLKQSDLRFECVMGEVHAGRKEEAVRSDRLAFWQEACLSKLRHSRSTLFVPCGSLALQTLTEHKSIDDWQLSIVPATRLGGRKTIPLIHPDRVFAKYSEIPFLLFGMQRIREEMESPLIRAKPRAFHIGPTFERAYDFLINKCLFADELSIDIETAWGQITCFGVGPTPTEAMSIPVLPENWAPEQFHKIWEAIHDVLAGPARKIFQNFIYDCTYLSKYGLTVRNLWHDTMLAQKFLYPELPMGLDTIARIYTREPYWKGEGKDWKNVGDLRQFWIYNCFMKGTLVCTERGNLPIEEIVAQKLKLRVRSYNENTKTVEWKPIVNWIKNQHPEKIKWVQIIPEHLPNNRGLICTPDHKILTAKGWKNAEQITTQDYLMIEGLRLDAGTVIGTLHGDSSFGYTSNKGKAYLQCSQVNKELIELKQKLFGGSVTGPREHVTNYGKSIMWDLHVPCNHQLKRLSKVLRKNKRKRAFGLAQLTPMGIALWYLDDGTLDKGCARLAVHGYSNVDKERIRSFFGCRYKATVRLGKCGSLFFCARATTALCAEIGNLVPPSIRYKLRKGAPLFEESLLERYRAKVEPLNVKVIFAGPYKSHHVSGGYTATSYCLTVADNHNFMTPFGLVKNCKDVTVTHEAAHAQRVDLKARGLEEAFEKRVMRLCRPAAEMCWRGLPVDLTWRAALRAELDSEVTTLNEKLSELTAPVLGAPLNSRSPKQVKEFIKARGYRVLTKKGKETSDVTALMKLQGRYPADPVFALLITLSEKNKAISSYLKPTPYADGRMRYRLGVSTTDTGRWSSGLDPWDNGFNAQTIPSSFKKMFRAPPGWLFLETDLEQADARYVAWDAPEPTLIKFFTEGRDIHRFVSSRPELFNKPENEVTGDERQLGKKVGHASNYGMRGARLSEICLLEMGVSVAPIRADQMLEGYHRVFPGIRMRQQRIQTEIRRVKKLTTPLGRERYFFDRIGEDLFRAAYAYAPQSVVCDVINCLTVYLDDNRDPSRLHHILQVHDSYIALVHEDYVDTAMGLIRQTDAWNPKISLPGGVLQIPTKTKIGACWGEMKEVSA